MKKTEKENRKREEAAGRRSIVRRLIAVLLFAVIFAGCQGESADAAGTDLLSASEISWGEVLYFNNHYDTEFYIDGHLAFCMEALKDVPDDGQMMAQSFYDNKDVKRALYYGWGGAGQWEGFTGKEHGYVTTSRVLSHYYSGYPGELDEYEQAFINYLNTRPYLEPIGFEPESVTAAYNMEENKQITETIQVTGSAAIGVEILVPEGATLVNETLQTRASKTAVVHGGERIHFEAEAEAIQGGSWSSGDLKVTQDYQPVVVQASNGDGSKQRCVYLRAVSNKDNCEGIAVEWENLGKIRINKKDAEIEKPQGKGTLEGAVYEIQSKEGAVIRTVTTGKDGSGASEYMVQGEYVVKEKESPQGYVLDEKAYPILLDSEEVQCDLSEQVIRGGVKIKKRDLETKKDEAQGSAVLKDALLEIITLNDQPVLVEGEVYEKNDVVLTISTDENGLASTGAEVLPYGSYRISESEAPEGYLKSGQIFREFEIAEQGVLVDMTGEEYSILDQVKRGDIKGVKIGAGTQKRLANIPFRITSKTTGESHVVVTDQNGQFSTSADWTSHKNNTNEGASSEDGVWFGTGEPDDDKGALPYDVYEVEELRAESNEGFQLVPAFEIVVSKDNVTIDLGTLTDEYAEEEKEEEEVPKKTVEIEVKEKAGAVRTGDEAGVILLIISILSCVAVITCVMIARRMKKR